MRQNFHRILTLVSLLPQNQRRLLQPLTQSQQPLLLLPQQRQQLLQQLPQQLLQQLPQQQLQQVSLIRLL